MLDAITRSRLRTTVVTLVLTGLVYPLAMTGVGAGALSRTRPTAAWSPTSTDRSIGSELIGQSFSAPGYFWPRPSAAGTDGYDATASSGFEPRADLAEAARPDHRRHRAPARGTTPTRAGPIPAELVTTSASGLDPHLSPAAALWQVPRVARARGVAPERVRARGRGATPRGARSASSASRASTCCCSTSRSTASSVERS